MKRISVNIPSKRSPSRVTSGRTAAAASRQNEIERRVSAIADSDQYMTSDGLARVRVGDCRAILRELMPEIRGKVDLVFADPPFNWNRAYDRWDDDIPEDEYLSFTYEWIDLCVEALRPGGALWINIPDDWAGEIVCYLKGRIARRDDPDRRIHPMVMQNWCIWHYRFGQNLTGRFINSKVHALYFTKGHQDRTWNPDPVLEMSDRAAIYADVRTQSKKDGIPPGLRVPMDVWYGPFWGRIQGNNTERRGYHDNQLPEVYLHRVIASCSNENNLVLDPFLGSGTTGVVAYHLKRRFLGCEYSVDNAKRAFDRITDGPKRSFDQSRGMSTAIFPARGGQPRANHETASITPDESTPEPAVQRVLGRASASRTSPKKSTVPRRKSAR